LNNTVPVAAEGVTVAVRTTVWPGEDAAGAAESAVVVVGEFTVSITMADLAAALMASPL